jgi:hypothetical protein
MKHPTIFGIFLLVSLGSASLARAQTFPNSNGKRQVRNYTFKDGVLSYAVPASAYGGGVVAYSLLRRVGP